MTSSLGPRPVDWRLAITSIAPVLARHAASLQAAQILAAHGQLRAAESAYNELLREQPQHLGALRALAQLLRSSGRYDEACQLLRRLYLAEMAGLDLSPAAVAQAVAFQLAAEGYGEVPETSPMEWVEAKFDRGAETFDDLLVGRLKYCAPETICTALAECGVGAADGKFQIIDVGCGTGLVGPLVRPWAQRLDGVDLSARMIQKAQQRNVYDELIAGDLLKVLAERPARYDLAIAADVFVYFGDLRAPLMACAGTMRGSGLLSFTVEAAPGGTYELPPTGRYRHSRTYLEQVAEETGFAVRILRDSVVRYEQMAPVASYLCVWERTEQQEDSDGLLQPSS